VVSEELDAPGFFMIFSALVKERQPKASNATASTNGTDGAK
jgi:hypothetical protein